MEWIAILTTIIQEAPAWIKTVEQGIAWARRAWESTKAAYDKPASEITKEELIAHIRHFERSSDVIQNLE